MAIFSRGWHSSRVFITRRDGASAHSSQDIEATRWDRDDWSDIVPGFRPCGYSFLPRGYSDDYRPEQLGHFDLYF